jgi:hypothetical protein
MHTPTSNRTTALRLAMPAAICALALLLLAACSARVTLPAAPEQPRSVLLLEHGRHTSLVLTDADQVPWRFAYADWDWYVEGERGVGAAGSALLGRSQAALGRRALRVPEDGDWQPQVGSTIVQLTDFDAEADAVDTLLAQLHAHFAQTEPQPVASLMLEVVPHPRPYTFGHNSNHKVAGWLRAVGAEVRGDPAVGRWRIER